MAAPERQQKPDRARRPALGFEPSGFFALRSPLLPWDDLSAWSAELRAPRATPETLEVALAEDRRVQRERLRAILARPEVDEAVFVASPSLHESLGHWRKEPESERGIKTERALVRYFGRMAARATPFGLFAGCSVGTIGDETRFELPPRAAYGRHTRLDMDYVCALTDRLAKDPELRRDLVHRPNTSLYRACGRLRYAESRMVGRIRGYHLVAVEPTDYLEATLARAAGGAHPRALAEALVAADPEVSLQEAEQYIDTLVDSQLLVPDLEPAITGPEPLPDIIATLAPLPAGRPHAEALVSVDRAIAAIDARGVGGGTEEYRAIARTLEPLPVPAELPRLFQVDMVKRAPGLSLGQRVVDELARGVSLLHALAPGGRDEGALERFREAFERRYESRWVPLVEALDEESGIGFAASVAPSAEAAPLLEGLVFPAGPRDETTPWSDRERILLRTVEHMARAGASELVLSDADVAALSRKDPPPLPDAFAAMGIVAAASAEALSAGDFRLHVMHAGGPSGANLLGRFCHGDPDLEARVREHIAAEEALRPDALFAEVVHQPEGRVGNILARPVLRGTEIVYLGRSGAPRGAQRAVTDLLVTVRGGRVLLQEAGTGRPVLPRLTTAHFFGHGGNLGVYRFLCALPYQGTGSAPSWSWGALAGLERLPRVVHGRVVLARARWNLAKSRVDRLSAAKGAAARWEAVQTMRRELGTPRWIEVVEADNELPIDLDSALCVDTFLSLVKGQSWVELVEAWPGEAELCAHGPEGRFTHQLVVPFVRTPGTEAPRSRQSAPPAAHRSPRAFPPGSEWLYAKLYTGNATAEGVLREAVRPVVDDCLGAGLADAWFFIRYNDPDGHLRVRFHGAPAVLTGEVLPRLTRALEPLGADGRVWKLQLDTYERELERYGGDAGIALAEKWFRADSDAVLGIVGLEELADARWQLALLGIDLLLGDLGLDLAARLALMTRLRDAFGQEHRADAAFGKQLGDRFRRERAALEALLDPARPADHPLAPGIELLAARADAQRALAAGLGAAGLPTAELASSYVHMHVNRMMRAAQRAQELVLYDFLQRLYESRQARERAAAKRAT